MVVKLSYKCVCIKIFVLCSFELGGVCVMGRGTMVSTPHLNISLCSGPW